MLCTSMLCMAVPLLVGLLLVVLFVAFGLPYLMGQEVPTIQDYIERRDDYKARAGGGGRLRVPGIDQSLHGVGTVLRPED